MNKEKNVLPVVENALKVMVSTFLFIKKEEMTLSEKIHVAHFIEDCVAIGDDCEEYYIIVNEIAQTICYEDMFEDMDEEDTLQHVRKIISFVQADVTDIPPVIRRGIAHYYKP